MSVKHSIPHLRQAHNWDCGLACTEMLLRYMKKEPCSLADIREICPSKSVWTIDLAYILKHYQVNFAFFTITIGVNNGYSNESYYKADLPKDEIRVNDLFQAAEKNGILCEKRQLTQEEIKKALLTGQFVMIVLIDRTRLVCSQCKKNRFSLLPWKKSGPASNNQASYVGHYVLLCGYDESRNQYCYLDPAENADMCFCSDESLENARKSFGTDEDILVIELSPELHQHGKPASPLYHSA